MVILENTYPPSARILFLLQLFLSLSLSKLTLKVKMKHIISTVTQIQFFLPICYSQFWEQFLSTRIFSTLLSFYLYWICYFIFSLNSKRTQLLGDCMHELSEDSWLMSKEALER